MDGVCGICRSEETVSNEWKGKMKKILVYLMRFGLQMIYSVLKLFPTKKNKIVFLSRQSDTLTPDFEMVQQELRREDPEVEIVTIAIGLRARAAADCAVCLRSRDRPCAACIIWQQLRYVCWMRIGLRSRCCITKNR